MSQGLQDVLLSVLSAVLLGAVGYGFTLLRAYTLPKIKNEEVKEIAAFGIDIIQTAVLDVSENFVKELKRDGNFTEEDARLALIKTKDKVVAQANERLIKLVEKHYGNFETWLEQQIEAFVAHD